MAIETLSHVTRTLSHTHTQYGIVIDAGSAHTDIYIYSWQLPFINNTGLVTQRFDWSINGNLFSPLFSA